MNAYISEEQLRIILEEYTTASIWDIVYYITTFLMFCVSVISLNVTWKVFKQSKQIHNETMSLSQKTHEDSLTPYVVVEEIKNKLTFQVIGYPEIHVDEIAINENVLLNNRREVSVNNIIGKILIEIFIFNMTEVPAEVEISLKVLNYELQRKEYLMGKGKKNVKFEEEIVFNKTSLRESFYNKTVVQFMMSYKGPGMSAMDTLEGDMVLNYSSMDNLVQSKLKSVKMERVYSEV